MRATHLPTAARHCSSEIGMSPAQTEEADKVERGHLQFGRPIIPHIGWINRRAKCSLSEAQLCGRPSLAQSTHTTPAYKAQIQAVDGATTVIR